MTTEIVKITLAETRAFVLYKLEDDILLFEYNNNICVEIEDVKEAFDLYVEHAINLSLKVLIVFGEFSTITAEARKYSENKIMPTPAQALVIKNLAQRIMAKFYGLFRKDVHPFQYFGEMEEALLWLKKY